MAIKNQMDTLNYRKQQDYIRNQQFQKRYKLDDLVQQRLTEKQKKAEEKARKEAEFREVYNTNVPNLIQAYAKDPAGFGIEVGALAADYPDVSGGAYDKALKQYEATYGRSGGSKDILPSLLRAYGNDAGFVIQTYGGGKIPTNSSDFSAMTQAAATDPKYGEKRTRWQNSHVANTKKRIGAAADDPKQSIYEDRFGHQVRVANQGDAISQKLSNPTTEEVNKLDAYNNTYNEINKIGETIDDAFTGIYEGNWNNLKSKFVNTPEFQKHKARVEKLRTIVYGLSGKAINETEQKWLDTILPKLAQPDENFKANLDELKNWVEDRQQSYLISLRNSRRFVNTKPLKDKKWTVDMATPEQEDAAFDALGIDATDAQIDEWLLEHYGGK